MEQNTDIAILLRCRYRIWQLSFVLKNIYKLFNNTKIDYKIILLPDRPTPDVKRVIDYYVSRHSDRIMLCEINDGCTEHRWAKSGMQGLNRGLEFMDEHNIRPKWVRMCDDDETLPVKASDELVKCLEDDDVLAWVATSLYLWGSFKQVNMNIFHYSPIIFRYNKGDRYPEDGRSTQVTSEIQKRILRNMYRKKTLPFFLYDLSAMTRPDRQKQIKRFEKANKDDCYTRSYSETPQIMTLKDIESNYTPQGFAELQTRKKGLM